MNHSSSQKKTHWSLHYQEKYNFLKTAFQLVMVMHASKPGTPEPEAGRLLGVQS